MDPESILETVRSGHVPSEWTVWPLRRDVVLRSALEYLIFGIIGIALFIPVVLSTVPSNFQASAFEAIVTALLILMFVIIGFGGLGVAAFDFYRVTNADRYMIVLTPDDLVLSTPRHITHVPLEDVTFLTLKGVKDDRAPDPEANPDMVRGAFLGMGRMVTMRTRQPKQAPSLAFLDKRTGREVVVARDNSYEDLSALEDIMSTYVFNKERRLRTG